MICLHRNYLLIQGYEREEVEWKMKWGERVRKSDLEEKEGW